MIRKMMKNNNKGVTLVALSVTVAVLLVLAAAAIGVMVNSGIIGKAEETVMNYDDKGTEDEIRKAYFSYLTALELDPNSNVTFPSKLAEYGINYDSISGNDIDGYTIRITLKNGQEKLYEIDGDGMINKVLNGIVGTNNMLGYIPYGTGNDFHRTAKEILEPGENDIDIIIFK